MKFQRLNCYYISTTMSCLRSNTTLCHMVKWSPPSNGTSRVSHFISELRLVSEVDGVLYMSHETILVGLAMRHLSLSHDNSYFFVDVRFVRVLYSCSRYNMHQRQGVRCMWYCVSLHMWELQHHQNLYPTMCVRLFLSPWYGGAGR